MFTGVDWGGLRREWFQLVCAALFDPKNQLFKGFSDNQQVKWTLKHILDITSHTITLSTQHVRFRTIYVKTIKHTIPSHINYITLIL